MAGPKVSPRGIASNAGPKNNPDPGTNHQSIKTEITHTLPVGIALFNYESFV